MIKFEEHEGQLFRMLEKPVPCQGQLKWNYIAGIAHDKPLLIRDVPKIVNPRTSIKTLNDLSKVKYVVHYDMPVEIIGYPVAEGSAEWALYQMMQGKMVCHETSPWDWYRMYNDHAIQNRTVGYMDRVSAWLESTVQSGWQIYKEHEQIQEPESMGLAKQICEIDHNLPKGLTSCEAIGLAGFCKECFAKNDGCWKEQEDMKEEPEPEQPKFKVGDWVKYDIDTYLQVTEPSDKDRTWCRTISGIMVYPYTSCLTKLSPSEVVIHIGCLSGTIEKSCDHSYFLMRHSSPKLDCDYSIIRFSAIDKETRELVEDLLKAQEEK